MIHHEGEIQTRKRSGVYNVDGKFIPLGKVLTKSPRWWEKCYQQIARQKEGLRLSERLRAIACVNPLLDSPEEWGESVSSFLANGNNLLCAVVAIESGRNKVVSGHEAWGFSYPTRCDRSGELLTSA